MRRNHHALPVFCLYHFKLSSLCELKLNMQISSDSNALVNMAGTSPKQLQKFKLKLIEIKESFNAIPQSHQSLFNIPIQLVSTILGSVNKDYFHQQKVLLGSTSPEFPFFIIMKTEADKNYCKSMKGKYSFFPFHPLCFFLFFLRPSCSSAQQYQPVHKISVSKWKILF